MERQSHARPGHDGSTERKIVLALIVAAGLFSGIPFAGWVFDAPSLKSFGVSGHPMWPLSAVGYIFLAAGFWSTIARHRIAPILLAVPILIALCALTANVAGISPGIDLLLFPDQVGQFDGDSPGRPVAN